MSTQDFYELSVVTGTYNRISYLKKFVHSVRMSIGGMRFPYEIVIVDGGSTDGTIDWCLGQEDIVLIQQGKLLGAVKAFNEGAQKARGRYVVLANDDIEFIYETLLNAYRIISDNQQVGVGCFYQNRNDRDFHVEFMPAISDGKQVSVPYGQVCIVPKALGDKVGWWGNITKTYGGDNELSCNILELGYDVAPFECCCINDQKADDNLRKINQGDPQYLSKQGKGHPDTTAWTTKWKRKNGMVGPIVPTKKVTFPLKRLPRVLYAPIYEQGNELQRKTKTGLYRAMSQVGWAVCEHDYMTYGIDHLYDVADAFKPHLFLLQIQNARTFNARFLRELKQAHPNAIFVSWNGDYHPNELNDQRYMDCMRLMDFATFVTADIKEKYLKSGINWRYWQIGFEESKAKPNNRLPRHDVLFMGNAYSQKRMDLINALAALRNEGIDVGLYGHMPEGLANGNTLYNFDLGHRLLQTAKIVVSDQQWPEATGYVSNRLTQSLYAGAFVLQQKFAGVEEYMGLTDDHHLKLWYSIEDLQQRIRYWVKEANPSKRAEIAKNGHEYALKHYSFDARLQELMYEIRTIARDNPSASLLSNT